MLTGHGAAINRTPTADKLVFGIFAALVEFERELIAAHAGGLGLGAGA